MFTDTPDPETGEIPSAPVLNCETGELEIILNHVHVTLSAKKPFKIPRNLFENEEDVGIDVGNVNGADVKELKRRLFGDNEKIEDESGRDELKLEFTKKLIGTLKNEREKESRRKCVNVFDFRYYESLASSLLLFAPFVNYSTNVLKVVLHFWLQQNVYLNRTKIGDIYYQSLLKSFFRNVVPYLKREATRRSVMHLKRKGIKYGLQCVKRVKCF